jgi:hypothetical protein
MITSEDIIAALKTQGLTETASETEIKDALLKASWAEGDILRALNILRKQGTATSYDTTESAETLLYTDNTLSPQMVSKLLNINVLVQPGRMHAHAVNRVRQKDTDDGGALYTFLMILLALLFASAAGVGSLYVFHVGPFYAPTQVFD